MSIEKRVSNLPAKAEDLAEFILVGKKALIAQKAKLEAIVALEKGFAAKEAALSDTQDLAEVLLYAEAKLGELIPPPKRDKESSSKATSLHSLPEGVNKKQSHYAQQLSKNKEVIAQVVAKAREQGEVPVRQQVLREIQKAKPKPETPELPKGKYSVIYADPPWKYDFCIDSADKIENKYPTMEVEEIASMKIPTCNNTVLYLWATAPKLTQALYVLDKWGFKYKTNMTWDKEWIGMGYWFRGLHEHLLVGVKGNISPPAQELRVDSILHEKRTIHSKKPDIIYEWIEKWYPNQKWIELFARKKRKGWVSWGNEI